MEQTQEESVSVTLSNLKCSCQTHSSCTLLTNNSISIIIPGRKLPIPRQLFTVCEGNLAKCVMTQLKIYIKKHLHHIYSCESFSGAQVSCLWPDKMTISTNGLLNPYVVAEEEVRFEEDTFGVTVEEHEEGKYWLHFRKNLRLKTVESIDKCKLCKYIGSNKYTLKRHIESVHFRHVNFECEQYGSTKRQFEKCQIKFQIKCP